jgi:hypothetical protein
MSEQLQLRRGTATQVAAFTGAQGEVAFDTTTSRLFSNDGATVGGFPLALETVKSVSDAAYVALITDRQIAFSALTAARIVTLPAASAYPAGATLSIIDESGACSAALTITAARAGSDTINGSATSAVLANAFGALQLQSNGVNGWTIVNQTTPQASSPLAQGPAGSMAKFVVLEQFVSGLSGANVTAATQIPAGALVLACSARVVTAISGATSFEVGYTGSLSAFGSGLGVAAGSTNEGLVGPNPFYSATNLILTSAGGSFTAGAVRLSLYYLLFTPPAS